MSSLIDDEPSISHAVKTSLESMRHRVTQASSGHEALELLGDQPFDLALFDVRLAREQGLDLLSEMLRQAPDLQVIVLTASATMENAVEALHLGAFDYVLKPLTPDQLGIAIRRACEFRRRKMQVDALKEQARSVAPEVYLETEDPTMRKELDIALRAAASHAPILILGESGTGKDVLARAIHAHSPQAQAPFVTIHCSCLSAELLASELFGHVRGFAGAAESTLGKVHAANGGILLLDEIAEMPLALQPKLLRLLYENRYERVGETRTRTADIRLLAATSRNLEAEVATGRFREDLFYQLNVISVTAVSLRRRKGDVLPLARHFLAFFARESGKQVSSLTPEAEAALLDCPWPGNIRELRNVIERAVILAPGPSIGLEDLVSPIVKASRDSIEVGAPVSLVQLEAEHIRQILSTTQTMEDAARILGIDPSTLFRKRKRGFLLRARGTNGITPP